MTSGDPALQVMSLLGVKGRQVGKVLEQVTDWQLAHPHASADECCAWLKGLPAAGPES